MDTWQESHADLKPAAYKLPSWLARVMNDRLPEAVAEYREHRWRGDRVRKLQSAELVDFIVNSAWRNLFDHWGTDPAGNLISEPYYGTLSELESSVRELTEKLELRYAIRRAAYHAEGCVRVSFYKPEGQL